MTWPTPQDYNEAVQNPHINFLDYELKIGSVAITPLGLPFVASGAFASVYRTLCGDRQFAVRCFLKEIPNQHVRYERISQYVMNDTLPYTVEFNYLEKGIFLGGSWYPILKMDWVQGTTLDNYVRTNLSKPDKLAVITEQFKIMMQDLQAAGIAHGDLQHGNIMVTPEDELRLVDYDGMFVPELTGFGSNEIGHRNYQHPGRNATSFDAGMDNFSAWSIYTSLSSLCLDQSLANQLGACDESLLFRQDDYRYPLTSPVFALLEAHTEEAIRKKARLLRSLLSLPVESIPYLSDSLEAPETLPALQPIASPFHFSESKFSQPTRHDLERVDGDLETGHLWPSLIGYMKAVSNPGKNFIDPRMQQYVLVHEKDHSVHALGTDHGAVFRFRQAGGEYVLVKVFLKGDALMKPRYELLHSYIHDNGDNYQVLNKHFADFTFVPQGLKVDQRYYSVVKMKHLKMRTLFEAVEEGRADQNEMKSLMQRFSELMGALEKSGIVHGDIEPGNIMVDASRLVLVDYDLTTTPLSRPLASSMLGNRHYQHPLTKQGGPLLNDHFSAWILYYSLKLLMLYPPLWNIAGAKPGRLLFHADDLRNPISSHLFSILRSHHNDEVRNVAATVEQLCQTPPGEIPPLRHSSFLNRMFIQPVMAAPAKAGSSTALQAVSRLPVTETLIVGGVALAVGVSFFGYLFLIGAAGIAVFLILILDSSAKITGNKNPLQKKRKRKKP